MSVSERAFRDAMSSFATGVTVVTAPPSGNSPSVGVTINSFSSVSLKPPLILWCLDRSADTFPVFQRAERFAVNILRADQEEISFRFSASGDHTLSGIDHEVTKTGVPLISGALTQIECERTASYDGGDHVIYLGRAVSIRNNSGEPLLYFRRNYFGLGRS